MKPSTASPLKGFACPRQRPIASQPASQQRSLFLKEQKPQRLKGRLCHGVQLSLRHLRRAGYRVDVCERRIVAGGRSHTVDLHGFADLHAYSEREVVLVQCTTHDHLSRHLTHYRRDEELRRAILDWLAVPGRRFEIHAWGCYAMPTPNGKHVIRWRARIVNVTAGTLEPAP